MDKGIIIKKYISIPIPTSEWGLSFSTYHNMSENSSYIILLAAHWQNSTCVWTSSFPLFVVMKQVIVWICHWWTPGPFINSGDLGPVAARIQLSTVGMSVLARAGPRLMGVVLDQVQLCPDCVCHYLPRNKTTTQGRRLNQVLGSGFCVVF